MVSQDLVTRLHGSEVKNLPAKQEMWVQSLCQVDPLKKEMATHSTILACEIPMDRRMGRMQIQYQGLSAGKESALRAGDPGSIPGQGRSAERIGYPLHCSWASLVAQLVKNPPAMRENWVRSLGQEDSLEKGKATPSNTLAWRSP